MSTAAILAGGKAHRFGGRPKALFPLGDHRIIDRLLAVLRSVVDHVFIVGGEPGRFGTLGVPVREDVLPGTGPLGGIYTALAASTTPRTLIVAADMPFLHAQFLQHLMRVGRDFDIAIPRTADGQQPLCASYGEACAGNIERQISARTLKVTDILSGVRVGEIGPNEIAPFDPEGTLFFNINTPADYARGLALAAYRRDSSL